MSVVGGVRKRKLPEEMAATSALLKGQGSTKFVERWPGMRPVVLKLLKQEHVTRDEWQDLFWCVYLMCVWLDLCGCVCANCPVLYHTPQEHVDTGLNYT